jgi:hypothetical protein
MKLTKLKMAVFGIVTASGLFAFTAFKNGGIKGTVSPSAAATAALAIAGVDTIKVPINNGAFSMNEVKPGTYKLVIEAVSPYKDFEKEGVVVNDGKGTDVGEIPLQKQ